MHEIQWSEDFDKQGLEPKRQFWLTQQESTTKILRTIYQENALDIKVCYADWSQPNNMELDYLQTEPQECWLRETILYIHNKPWMWARTIIPKLALQTFNIDLTKIDKTPLGSVIFHEPGLARSEFSYSTLKPTDDMYQKIQQHSTINAKKLWARRSIFSLRDSNFCLTEVLLDDLPQLPAETVVAQIMSSR
jgi:chorismate--pyruvate lyase